MVNKKVIRKDRINGEFTTIHHSIINDSRLNSTSFRVLITILSDSDTKFNLSVTGISNRIGMDKGSIRRAFKQLCELGYMRMTKAKFGNGYFYIISEYGNLKTENSNNITVKDDEATLEVNHISQSVTEEESNRNLLLLNDYLESIGDYFLYKPVQNKINDLVMKYMVGERLSNWHELKQKLDRLIEKEKKAVYDECMKITSKINKHTSNKAITEYKAWLKNLVFEKNDLQFDYEKKWLRIKSKHYKFKTDAETAAYDEAEQRYYDGE